MFDCPTGLLDWWKLGDAPRFCPCRNRLQSDDRVTDIFFWTGVGMIFGSGVFTLAGVYLLP